MTHTQSKYCNPRAQGGPSVSYAMTVIAINKVGCLAADLLESCLDSKNPYNPKEIKNIIVICYHGDFQLKKVRYS